MGYGLYSLLCHGTVSNPSGRRRPPSKNKNTLGAGRFAPTGSTYSLSSRLDTTVTEQWWPGGGCRSDRMDFKNISRLPSHEFKMATRLPIIIRVTAEHFHTRHNYRGPARCSVLSWRMVQHLQLIGLCCRRPGRTKMESQWGFCLAQILSLGAQRSGKTQWKSQQQVVWHWSSTNLMNN